MEEHVGEVLPIAGAENSSLSQETLLPSLSGVGPPLRRSASSLCEASYFYLGRRSGAMGVVRRGHKVRSTLRLDAT